MFPCLVACFIAGLVVGSYVPYFPISVSGLLFLAAIGSVLLERTGKVACRSATAVLLSLLLGIAYWSWSVERTGHGTGIDDEGPAVQELTGRIIEPVQPAPDRFVLTVRSGEAESEGSAARLIRVTWRLPERALFQGDVIRFQAKLRAPNGSLNPGGFDYVAYLARQGVEAVTTVSGPDAVQLVESGGRDWRWMVWNQFDRWRGSIRLSAIQTIGQPALGIYLGVVLGDRGYLDPELRDAFMVTGTVHLLSISGSHLGLVAILAFVAARQSLLQLPARWLLRLSRTITPTRVAALLTVFPVVFYACLAGAELATVRSLLMVLVALLARWLGYEQRIFHALALAAGVILLHDPQAVYDISFQLSFLSVSAIAAWLELSRVEDAVSSVDRSVFRSTLKWTAAMVSMSWVITLVTLPLVAFYFNQVSWLGVITNLVAVPVMGFVLVPIGLFAAVWQLIHGGLALPLGNLIQRLIEVFIQGLDLVARVPKAEWHLASPSIPAMLLFYGTLILLWLGPSRHIFRWSAAACLGCCVLWWSWSPRLSIDGERFRVTFLDVAQGDSTVLELPDGQVVLIDGGTTYERFDMGRGVVGPFLWNRGINAVDYVIATHPQLDHVGGLAWLLNHFPVGNYWGIGIARDETFYHRLEKARLRRGLIEHVAHRGETIRFAPDCELTIENPPDSVSLSDGAVRNGKNGRDLNNRSIVARLTCGGHTILFPADVEQEALARMTIPSADPIEVLKVPHHGAASSFRADWITSMHPSHAVVSVGRHNPYGHPARSVLDSYESLGIPLWRTDRDGGIWITGSRRQSSLELHTTRSHRLQPTRRSSVWDSEKANWERLGRQWLQRL
ncbi:MAG TPA: DNA internalization-related competence protein ComEC/Rec2 [Nitrospira sp.]|nr:DNA internalization-related competence protein ComEC/Rec2 [Nitrospira sp.]